MAVDVEQRLKETREGIALFAAIGGHLPPEARDLEEILARCLDAERKLAALRLPELGDSPAMLLEPEPFVRWLLIDEEGRVLQSCIDEEIARKYQRRVAVPTWIGVVVNPRAAILPGSWHDPVGQRPDPRAGQA